MPSFEKPVAKRIYQGSILILLGLLMASCSENKVAQCSKLIDIANQAVSGVKTVSENSQPDTSIESMNKIADVANTAKAEMEGLQLTDEQLKGFQTRFIDMYTATTNATRDLVTAAEAKDAQAAQQAFNALQTATAQEGPLVNEVNAYCEAQPSPAAETLSPSVSPAAPSPSP
ncbi:MAG: hypothetical protein EDM05_047250 [Leptolyngbya sp. IPPAS B-1204]|nr:hypothetical protein [Elainella sp. C42_A2020_010]RNJ70640.1 MAG: hypothetical protein EDM05_01240 [Leptolyngbya sp. IPPAS B-1204]